MAEVPRRRLPLTLEAPAERAPGALGRTTSDPGATGTITRVNGPLVEAEGLAGVAMFDVVEPDPTSCPGRSSPSGTPC